MNYHEIEGAINFRGHTFNVWIKLEYDFSGYMEIKEMRVYREHPKRELYLPSKRFIKRFREEKFEWLYAQCLNANLPF
jgi:hypothetical protein